MPKRIPHNTANLQNLMGTVKAAVVAWHKERGTSHFEAALLVDTFATLIIDYAQAQAQDDPDMVVRMVYSACRVLNHRAHQAGVDLATLRAIAEEDIAQWGGPAIVWH